jgi:serine protease inhibitor
VNPRVTAAPIALLVTLGLASGNSSGGHVPSRTADLSSSEILFADSFVAAVGHEHSGNLVLSPVNAFDALAMLLPGARGASESQLRAALYTTEAPETVLAASIAAQDRLNGGGVDLAAARAAWLEQTFPVRPSYADTLAWAGAPAQAVDFAGAPDAAREAVNSWATAHTRGRIHDLLPAGSVDRNTALILATALALDARWATPFDKTRTMSATFRGASGTSDVLTMYATTTFPYTSGPGYQAIELPYENSRLSAVIVLPCAGVDPLTLLPKLPAISSAMQLKRVALALPRAELSTALDLKPALGSLGLGQLFTRSADLSGIGGRPGDLAVAAARQQTWLTIGEEGTQAAVATALVAHVVSLTTDTSAIQMKVDRPFLFVVHDRDNGVALFVARIADVG